MHKAKAVRTVAVAAALIGAATLLIQYLPGSIAAANKVHATKALAAPTFSSKATTKAKQDKAFTFTVKTKANPGPASITVTGGLPAGASFKDNGNGTATLSDPDPLASATPYSIDLAATNSIGTTDQTLSLTVTSKLPLVRHVFVIMLENNDYSATFGNPSADPYLAQTLPSQGMLVKNYYGVGHFSNDNYTGFISGQPPTSDNQADCIGGFVNFPTDVQGANGIQQGNGCVYPSAVSTLANQLDGDGLTWKGYMEDMGNDPTREAANCGHPSVGGSDSSFTAEPADGYATRHDPFVYFHSIIGNTDVNTPECNQNVVPLGDTSGNLPATVLPGTTGLVTDLQSVATTPNFTFIAPNLCDDGHDYHCINTTGAGVGGGSSVGDINQWLETWVPIITSSPAFKQDGLLEITFDEAEQGPIGVDGTACCGETPGPANNSGGNGIDGPGGGKVGAVLISPFITPGAVAPKTTDYNHYSSLASIEDLFGLPHLGEAQTVTTNFDKHIYAG
jgi:phosphatidylinositol-3-phosphatase